MNQKFFFGRRPRTQRNIFSRQRCRSHDGRVLHDSHVVVVSSQKRKASDEKGLEGGAINHRAPPVRELRRPNSESGHLYLDPAAALLSL